MKSVFDRVLTVKECAERYKLNPKYIQHVIWEKRLLKTGRDICLKGNTWLILDTAAEKLWGHRLIEAPPGQRVCRKCRNFYPETAGYFSPYRTSGGEGLMHICRGCERLQDSAYHQRNKARLRPIRRKYAQKYRVDFPEREANAQKRKRLKRALRRAEMIP